MKYQKKFLNFKYLLKKFTDIELYRKSNVLMVYQEIIFPWLAIYVEESVNKK